jgi:heterogeneous nuclear ribonucleoprotein U-like protein 1
VSSPSTLPAHGPQPAAQWVPNQDSSYSWSYDSYRPPYYGQQSHGK